MSLAIDSEVDAVIATMFEHQFDAAPVMTEGVPVGVFVPASEAARGPGAVVGELMLPLAAPLIVSGEATLDHLMERMAREPFLFVLGESGITSFVTPADLGSVPVRTHFYLRLAHLETVLGNYLRVRYPDQSQIVALLSSPRQESHAKIANELRGRDTFIDDVSCLSVRDLVQVLGKEDSYRRATKEAGVGWRRAISGLSDFRNDIMHPTRTLAGAGVSRPEYLLERQRRIDALIQATRSVANEPRALARVD
ncbi:hypothetical protein [Occultella gossypii]|uniref:CBS domain-containing protein n=1 Tax=Occultella gossypii TaxID=2800820 RepID=A0ABS7S509_9MICO|nr:hypothetical protein [Occultella gossypii]MBZ2195405.1 hypothetical protein [Occultella gossypii]